MKENESSERAEEIYAEYLARVDCGEDLEFEVIRAQHASLAVELDRLREEHLAARSLRRLLGFETSGAQPGAAAEAELPAGEVVGLLDRLRDLSPRRSPFAIRGRLGAGGFGVVFEAEEAGLRRRVAMKTMRDSDLRPSAGGASGARTFRFLEEAQTAGQLQHPGIPAVHSIGVDEELGPYFTMPVIGGDDLSQVFRRARSGEAGWTRTRTLGAILKVCEAMAYAHSKGVVHRDLKPDNVRAGEFGEVYVLDWGLARVAGREVELDAWERRRSAVLTDRSRLLAETPASPLRTAEGAIVGTPAYMSPEQALGRTEEIGPASDVYAVGAMLYELLAGHPPYLEPGAERSSRAVLARLVAGSPPEIESRAAGAPAELCAICAKAMARPREERYADMGELAADLRAYLDDRVVRAHRTGAWPELSKWVVRNRALAATLSGALLVAVAGSISVAAVLAAKNEAIRVERDSAEEIADFLEELFIAPSPDWEGTEVTAIDLLDAAEERIAGELEGEPLVRARLQNVMGNAYGSLAEFDRAVPLLEAALDARRTHLGDEHADTLESLHNLAGMAIERGDLIEAGRKCETLVETSTRALGPEAVETLRFRDTLALVRLHEERAAEAGEIAHETLKRRERAGLQDEHGIITTLDTLGGVFYEQDDFEQALEFFRRAHSAGVDILGPDATLTLNALGNVAGALRALGRSTEAETALRELVEREAEVLGPAHPGSLASRSDLADLLREQGRDEEAEAVLLAAWQTTAAERGDGDLATSQALASLADLYLESGRTEEAVDRLEQVLETRRGLLAEEHPLVLETLRALADACSAAGNLERSAELHAEALKQYELHYDESDHRLLEAMFDLAIALRDLERHDEAVGLFERELEACERVFGERHPQALGSLHDLAEYLLELGRTGEAARRAEALLERTRDHPDNREMAERLLERVRAAGG